MIPKIFIGSSAESINIVEALISNLKHNAWCTPWTIAFNAGKNVIDALIEEISKNDFAIFVFANDDYVKLRDALIMTVRDNVLFESGMAMGILGKDRVFIVKPQGVSDFRMPSDFSGVITTEYNFQRVLNKNELVAALTPAAIDIKNSIGESLWNNFKLPIKAESKFDPNAMFKLKIHFNITNPYIYPVTIQSISFKFIPPFELADNRTLNGIQSSIPLFIRYEDNGYEFKEQITIEAKENVKSCWIPINSNIGETKLKEALEKREVGVWEYRCVWLKEQAIACNYKEKL